MAALVRKTSIMSLTCVRVLTARFHSSSYMQEPSELQQTISILKAVDRKNPSPTPLVNAIFNLTHSLAKESEVEVDQAVQQAFKDDDLRQKVDHLQALIVDMKAKKEAAEIKQDEEAHYSTVRAQAMRSDISQAITNGFQTVNHQLENLQNDNNHLRTELKLIVDELNNEVHENRFKNELRAGFKDEVETMGRAWMHELKAEFKEEVDSMEKVVVRQLQGTCVDIFDLKASLEELRGTISDKLANLKDELKPRAEEDISDKLVQLNSLLNAVSKEIHEKLEALKEELVEELSDSSGYDTDDHRCNLEEIRNFQEEILDEVKRNAQDNICLDDFHDIKEEIQQEVTAIQQGVSDVKESIRDLETFLNSDKIILSAINHELEDVVRKAVAKARTELNEPSHWEE